MMKHYKWREPLLEYYAPARADLTIQAHLFLLFLDFKQCKCCDNDHNGEESTNDYSYHALHNEE